MSEAAVLPRSHAEASSAGSILIIDDEAAIRESLETLLEFEGYGVESAETAARKRKTSSSSAR
jgi:DNA-binding NtrC family response regulator